MAQRTLIVHWPGVTKPGGVSEALVRNIKLIHFYESDIWELYDLDNDPHKITNQYDDPKRAKVISELRRRLRGVQTRLGDPVAKRRN